MFWDQSFDDHETVKVNMFRLTMHAYALFVIYVLLQTSHADGKDLMLSRLSTIQKSYSCLCSVCTFCLAIYFTN